MNRKRMIEVLKRASNFWEELASDASMEGITDSYEAFESREELRLAIATLEKGNVEQT